MMSPSRINLGAGRTYLPGFVNVDIAPWADVSVDLDRDPLPFGSDSADLVFSAHTLEHVENYLGVLDEIHRVLRHGGWLLLTLPYVTLTEYHLVNPYHRRGFSEYSFDFFDPDKLQGSAVERPRATFRQVFHTFRYLPEFTDRSPRRQAWSRRHLLNVVREISIGLLAIKDGQPPTEVTEDLWQQMRVELLRCSADRRPYPRELRMVRR